MPAVVPVAAGFVAGVFAGLLLPGNAWATWPACALAASALWRGGRAGSILLLALAAGGAWGAAAAARASRSCAAEWRDGQRIALVVEPWDLGEPGGRSRVRVRVPAGCAVVFSAVWPRGVGPPAGPAVVEGTWYRAAGGGSAWWPSRPEAGAKLLVRRVRPLGGAAGPRSRLRLGAERRLLALFGDRRFPLVSALTLGSSDQIEFETRRRFARSGLAHLLAISGLHVAILAGALVFALRLAGVPPAQARRLSVPAVAAYVCLLGMPPPALRSAALLAVWEAARARQRPPLRGAVLAVCALLVVALDPFAACEVGPWLSFAGAWGAAEGTRWWSALGWKERWREGRVYGLGEAAAVSLGATLATAPISALGFGTIASAAVVTNLLAVPTVAALVPGLALALLASAVWPTAAAVAAAASGLLLDALDRIASVGAGLPLATLALPDRGLAAIAALAVLWLWRRIALPGRRSPYAGVARWRTLTAAAAAAAGAMWWPDGGRGGSGYRPGWLEIHSLSVGLGDAVALRTPGGRWMLVDGGPRAPGRDAGAQIVAPFLRGHGVERLAVVVASHADADHLGGLPAVLRSVPADLVLEPGDAPGERRYRQWLASVVRSGARWRRARAGDSLVVDGVVVRVLHPDSAWLARRLPVNENSVVLRVEYGAFRALLQGDAGLPVEAALAEAAGPVAALKVAHHASRSASGPGWLRALAPQVCVVSVGENRMGLPAPAVLRDLSAAGCATYRTDVSGHVTLATDGRVAVVRTRAGEDSVPLAQRGLP